MKTLPCLIVVVLCCAGTGCNALNHSRNMKMVGTMSPTPEDRADTYEDENRVNREREDMMLGARHDLPPSKETGGWWNMLSSAEARSIERSVGVQYQ